MQEFPEDALDFIYHDALPILDDSVGPPFYLQGKSFAGNLRFERNLCTIIRTHTPLYPAMDSASLQHGLFVRAAPCSVVDVPLAQNKFHQIADRYFDQFFFFHVCYYTSFKQEKPLLLPLNYYGKLNIILSADLFLPHGNLTPRFLCNHFGAVEAKPPVPSLFALRSKSILKKMSDLFQ